jgi:acetylornithine deacetylase/succinyl-diaminopimelate desuccinylase-like protein
MSRRWKLICRPRARGQRQMPFRGRGRNRQPESALIRGAQRSPPRRRRRRYLGYADSRSRPSRDQSRRGALYLELEVRGPKRDLHSGNFGGAVHNLLQALCEIVAALHDADGRIAIPGFYDRVRRWSANERSYMADAGPSDAEFLEAAQTERGWGESGYSSYERLTLRPALTINGITGGYQGPGAKGVVPARALAKLSFRLAPDQDPREVDRLFREHVARVTPETVRSTVRTLSGAFPAVIECKHPAMRAAALAYRHGFGAAPVFLRSGGTIPAVNRFQQALGILTVMIGFALPGDHMHAPNEKFYFPNFFNGIATSLWFLAVIGAVRDLGISVGGGGVRHHAQPHDVRSGRR